MKITDEMLYRHAAEARDIWLDTLPDDSEIPVHEFSEEFNKEMERLVALSQKQKKPNKRLRRIAAMFAVIIIGASSFIGVNAEARAAFVGWIKELADDYLIYRYEGDPVPDAEPMVYRPAWIPEGYSEFLVDEEDDTKFLAYANEAREMLKLSYIHNPDETDWFISTENTVKESATVNGHKADLFISTDPDTAGGVIWSDENNCAFMLSGFLTVDDLLKMAESIRPVDPSELENSPESITPDLSSLNYQPTLIPEGYTWHRESDVGGCRLIVYRNEAGQLLRYHYVYDTASTAMFTVAEEGTHSIIEINGYQADMLLFDDPETSNCILWTDENNCAHAVHAFLDEEELIKLAESVKLLD